MGGAAGKPGSRKSAALAVSLLAGGGSLSQLVLAQVATESGHQRRGHGYGVTVGQVFLSCYSFGGGDGLLTC